MVYELFSVISSEMQAFIAALYVNTNQQVQETEKESQRIYNVNTSPLKPKVETVSQYIYKVHPGDSTLRDVLIEIPDITEKIRNSVPRETVKEQIKAAGREIVKNIINELV